MEDKEFYIGQIFTGDYPEGAAEWCGNNNATIEETTPEGAEQREFTIVAIPDPAPEVILKGYENAVQEHLDKTAQSRDYDNTYTCLSYLNSTDEIWRRESNAFNAWRDQVWRKCHEILNAFMAGEIPQPSMEELIAQLPVIDWNDPESV